GRVISTQMQGLGGSSNLPNVTLSFQYSVTNKRTRLTDPTGATTYNFDTIDRMTSLTNPMGETFSLAYNDATGGGSITRPGSQTVLSVDSAGLLSSIVHSSGGTSLASFSLTRDNNGNVTQIATGTNTRNFGYDPNQQLVSATYSPNGSQPNESYSY